VLSSGNDADLDRLQRSMERLLRLSASRKRHANLTVEADVDISPPGAVLLRRIVETGPVALGELSHSTAIDPAATSRQVRMLDEPGLVERAMSPTDRRVSILTVTDAGRAAHRRLAAVGDQHLHDVMRTWSKTDRAQFADLFARMVDEMVEIPFRPPE
jgi:DNA-binding MarR family transcriptional regulator